MGKIMRLVKSENKVEYIRSEIVLSNHAFATRIGGVSTEAHTASLNLAFGRGDGRQTVLENLRLFAEAVGFDFTRTVSVSQIHSSDVKYIGAPCAGQGYIINEEFERATKGNTQLLYSIGWYLSTVLRKKRERDEKTASDGELMWHSAD